MNAPLPEIRLPLTFQRLVMSAAASRDFAPAHIDHEAARAGGAPGAYADVMFVLAMFERCVGEWAGTRASLESLRAVTLHDFVLTGQDAVVRGVIADESETSVTVDLILLQDNERQAATATAIMVRDGMR
ncbi:MULTISPECIES: MaoC/PaaZ C-terminal domain-containing protein [unclassified Rhodococcus (in: high G+C Gram-positive bacteria)]|uniref:MaoC/PaaZ C-terminal domain-containing protein n=1 Tax=unclassified Rhodococcus (in: high G+C Gram-positive bacteria) TaxID=192944 RepID=UPI000B9A7962|nr:MULTISPECIES: MaoC/PaaZ C-terminal domain-containing protein [unclassified Rhodococcus (in: high G+C Gram-positive bacteria)]OZC48068.1 hypothetical protein CH267_24440 [Rhodococcus sp. 06-621-2]OZD62537.1 hypothetical protein CH263_17325 [Rhodococcus sp. 06-1059B-a]OZF06151.1 hypothetical protein CH300_13215 [Rhodococcus sp. 15-1154-1]OZF50752.1 hypothetical protein CH293_14540 [Rhodococcus sp. 14-2470-1b]OZF54162.1 hypothetical protein CH292_06355 [Rhodococcus sp. 14-2470-1a]